MCVCVCVCVVCVVCVHVKDHALDILIFHIFMFRNRNYFVKFGKCEIC